MSTEHTTAQVDEALTWASDAKSLYAHIDPNELHPDIANGIILAAEVRRLRDERENWRVSSVAREAVSRAEQAEAKIAALVSAGDAMRMKAHLYGFARWHLAAAEWDAAKSSAPPTIPAEESHDDSAKQVAAFDAKPAYNPLVAALVSLLCQVRVNHPFLLSAWDESSEEISHKYSLEQQSLIRAHHQAEIAVSDSARSQEDQR